MTSILSGGLSLVSLPRLMGGTIVDNVLVHSVSLNAVRAGGIRSVLELSTVVGDRVVTEVCVCVVVVSVCR